MLSLHAAYKWATETKSRAENSFEANQEVLVRQAEGGNTRTWKNSQKKSLCYVKKTAYISYFIRSKSTTVSWRTDLGARPVISVLLQQSNTLSLFKVVDRFRTTICTKAVPLVNESVWEEKVILMAVLHRFIKIGYMLFSSGLGLVKSSVKLGVIDVTFLFLVLDVLCHKLSLTKFTIQELTNTLTFWSPSLVNSGHSCPSYAFLPSYNFKVFNRR